MLQYIVGIYTAWRRRGEPWSLMAVGGQGGASDRRKGGLAASWHRRGSMKRRQRRLNWVRVTRDPGVAEAYERSAEASADWNLALVEALRTHLDGSLLQSLSWPETSLTARQLALPLGDEQSLPSRVGRRPRARNAAEPVVERIAERIVS